MRKRIIIAGASGMVGNLIQNIASSNDQINEIISLVRRESDTTNSKVREIVVQDFLNPIIEATNLTNVHSIYFCIGVYTGAVSKEKFRSITVDIPVALGKLIYKYSPEAKFCLLSGSGADRSEQSRVMFAKDKGAAENLISKIGFKRFHTFRPAYIYPSIKREEPNLMYSVSRALYPVIKLFGKNASITSRDLASGMLKVGMGDFEQEVFENRDILEVLD